MKGSVLDSCDVHSVVLAEVAEGGQRIRQYGPLSLRNPTPIAAC